jgi:hypothetical protein
MNELVGLITQKTGLSDDMAQKVLDIVDGYVQNKLPAPVASQISNALSGQMSGASGSPMDQASSQGKGFLGNIFGGKSENQPTEH